MYIYIYACNVCICVCVKVCVYVSERVCVDSVDTVSMVLSDSQFHGCVFMKPRY